MLQMLFSRVNVDSGTLWTTEYSNIRDKIKKDQRVDSYLITSMAKAAELLQKEKLPQDVIHALLMRSLFILFLEDKGASAEAGLYDNIKKGTSTYLDILKDKSATYCLFKKLQEQFNGNITMMVPEEENIVTQDHLRVIIDCFFDGDFQHQNLFKDERLFNFEIIHIGLISEIYETFLGELRHNKGQFYTPFALADMILTEVLPTKSVEYDYPILDPACGSGIFLVEGYKRLIMRWENAHPNETISFETLVSILRDNVYGIEIDKTAIRVAAFSLYLTLIDKLDPKTLWNSENHRLPYLIFDPLDSNLEKKQGVNLWCQNTIKDINVDVFKKVKLVVGNPPYGRKVLPAEITEYCKKYRFAAEYVLPFMHIATRFCPNGRIALVFSSKVLFNNTSGYRQFRKWLFTQNVVTRIDNLSIFRKAPSFFGGSLFTDATCPVCVAYYASGKPDVNTFVKYCSPKSFIKTNIIDGLLIDESDIKMLPIAECQDSNSKIWKVAAWGNYYGYQLIKRITKTTLETYFREKGWMYGRGVNADSNRLDFIPDRLISTEKITRYQSDLSASITNSTKKYRSVKPNLFKAPFVVFKQGQHNGKIACSLFKENVFFTTTAFAINGGDEVEKKVLTAYLNSRLVKYLLFLTTSSWGVEREQVFLSELLALPSPFECLSKGSCDRIEGYFDELYDLSAAFVRDEIRIKELENKVEHEFEKAFELSERDCVYINDTLDYNIGVFEKRQYAIGYHRVLSDESRKYATTLTNSLCSLLKQARIITSATYYEVGINDPLQMVVLQLKTSNQLIEKGRIDDFKRILKSIDGYLTCKHSDSVYFRKTLKYYEGNYIYIIKPNQKRFWSMMQAYDDAAAIVNDILTL
jgi:Type I restriction-modification system methyltransferase subunit